MGNEEKLKVFTMKSVFKINVYEITKLFCGEIMGSLTLGSLQIGPDKTLEESHVEA